MSLGAILSAAGLAAAISLTNRACGGAGLRLRLRNRRRGRGQRRSVSLDGFVEADVVNEAHGEEFEVQSDLDRGTPAVTVAPESSTWATALLSLAGFGR
jgi:hypothetical protein